MQVMSTRASIASTSTRASFQSGSEKIASTTAQPPEPTSGKDVPLKRLYVRQFSNIIRKWSSYGELNMEENAVFNIVGPNRTIILTICRIRQRILAQAWATWIKSTGVQHNYESDVRVILSRKLPVEDFRTELEIEVLYKWIAQVKDIDPTGIAGTIYNCKKKAVIYDSLQQIRLEFFAPGDTVLFQGDIPRPEDGHFTIFHGECEVVQFPEESVPLLKLLYLAKKKKWDDARKLLHAGQVVAKIPKLSGFGELSTLTGVKRAATIRASRKLDSPVEILVLPKDPLLECLKSRFNDGVEGSATSEAIDFLRQSGLANRISPKDLVTAAGCMIRRTLLQGDVLYYKGETVKSIFLVVSGEFLLDIGESVIDGKLDPFAHSTIDKCFHLTSGSILGDEGLTGLNNAFESTAAVVSSAAVVFEAVGFGMRFLADKLNSLRYSALFYRDKLRFDYSYALAEQMNLYTYFNSLRKCIAYTKPFRGLSHNSVEASQKSPTRARSGSGSRSPSPKSSPHRKSSTHHQKYLEDRSRALEQRDTRVSFFLENHMAENVGQDSPSRPSSSNNSFAEVPRILTGIGLHRAIEFNKQAKKVLQNSIKVHAKDSILYEQLRKLPKDEEDVDPEFDQDRINAEKAFKKSFKEYLERVAERNRRIKEEEEAERQRKLAKGGSAIKFFASTVSEDEQDEAKSAALASRQGSLASIQSGSSGKLSRAASESSLSIRERLQQEGLSKIEQYFIWVDKLNRQNYRALLHQAQQTAEALNDHLIHETSNATVADDTTCSAESWKELAEVFQTFGLTPFDMNIPMNIRKSVEISRAATPKTPALPLDKLLQKAPSSPDMVNDDDKDGNEKSGKKTKMRHTPGGTFGTQRRAVIPDAHGAAMLRDEHHVKIMESKFKNYTPSSWRDDLIQKKAQELAAEVITFMRSDTPDNRKTLELHVIVSTHDELEQQALEGVDNNEANEQKQEQNFAEQSFEEFMHAIKYEQYIDSPDYFMKIITEMNLDFQRRVPVSTKPWQTRFMVIVNDPNAKKKRKSVKEAVRSHLKENLEGYSKEALLESVQKIKEESVTPFMKTINKQTWGPEEFAGRRDSFFDGEGTKSSFMGKTIRMSQINNSNSAIQQSLMKVREAMGSVDGIEKTFSGSTDNLEANLTIDTNVDSRFPAISSGSPKKETATPKTAQTPIQTLPSIAPTQRISDLKAPSKALQAFEDFLKNTQQSGSAKVAMEGKKRANKNSKFRLKKVEENYVDTVTLGGAYKKRLDMELSVFKSLYPNASKQEVDNFVKAFVERYPDVKLGPGFNITQEDSLSLDYMSVGSAANSLASSKGSYNSIDVGATTVKHSPSGKKITFNTSEEESVVSFKKKDDYDPDLEKWQQFTIDSIVQAKIGERKTLPGVSCKALEKGLSGKRYRSNRAQRGGSGTLVTIPAKSTEEPIDGPPNYLELYKTSFKLHTSSTEKAKVLDELRAKSASASRGGF